MFITDQPIDLVSFLGKNPPATCGASVFFVGRVRNHDEGKKVSRLFYECYQELAEKEIGNILTAVKQNTQVEDIRVVHRVGWLEIGDIAVAISASSAHREQAFIACRQVIERIKQDVPIWKKEIYEDSSENWVVCARGHHAIG